MKGDDRPLKRGEFIEFMEGFTKGLNEAFGYIYNRFDDMERRLDKVELRLGKVEQRLDMVDRNLHYVKNDTRLIPMTFEMIRTDGAEIGELKVRVERLEKQPDED